ncbi:AIPR family protein [Segatella hominis]|uniref:AIPR family protein n=1 Tax=Segatella hominis TaxID=2518605 RepID=UPI001C48A2FC|nr:AIPR family protein [Segatella hominis]WOZ80253.1 AIPR family protein [Segatella hominis]
MADSIKNYSKEIAEEVSELMDEMGSLPQAFTRYVIEKMSEKANLGEGEACYAAIRNDNNNNVLGEINGYSVSLSGETVTLFYAIYEPQDDEIYAVSADQYKKAINRLQGYYNAAVAGRCNEMEPSADDYKICKYIYENEEDITNVRLFVLTNGSIKRGLKTPGQRISDKLVTFDSWDINLLCSNMHSAIDHMSVDIDLLDDGDFKYSIPFIEYQTPTENYKTYIAMLPGEFLYRLYERYNTDLLQANVRFFKGKKGCNKGIFETLKECPHRFLAYNNGLTATAKEVLTEYNEDKKTGVLKYIENFQILNGGQTTASIYYAKKENPSVDLSEVYVQMKLVVLQDNIEEFHPLITKYSNTQTKVTASDYGSNNPFNHRLQELSRTTKAPDATHSGKISYWYYERVTGQYDQDLSRQATKADKDKFKIENPIQQKFDKCVLGKVYTAWKQRPDISINGPQKCYQSFIKENKDILPDNIFFEDFVAMLIIYRFMEKKNPVFLAYHQVKAQLTIYTLAMLYYVTNGKLSLYKIWKNQGLSDNLKNFINNLSQQLYAKLSEAQPNGTTFRDYCKSQKTWEATKKFVLTLDLKSIANDMKKEGEDEKRKQVSSESKLESIEQPSRKAQSALSKEKNSAALFKRIQNINDEDWHKIKLLVNRICDKEEANAVKKVAMQKDKSKLPYKKLVVVCNVLDRINEKFKETIGREF